MYSVKQHNNSMAEDRERKKGPQERRALRGILFAFLWQAVLLVPGLAAQQAVQADIEELKKTAPKVYIDCESCDIDYIRTEITFVNYVRDRKEAQVHVLITTQRTGSGGYEYTLSFLGQNEFKGDDNTVRLLYRPS